MYRRDISHILRLLAIALGLFVLYQVWIKPAYVDPPAPLPTAETPVPIPATPLTLSLPENTASSDVPQVRLVDPGDAPTPQLSKIREDLDRGNYKTVEAHLRKLPQQALKSDPAKHYAAALWNNLGIQQEKFGGIAVSVNAFKQAAKLDPMNSIILMNLTQAYWGLRDPAMTPEFLQTVIRHAPNDPFPHLALADILIERGNNAAASEHLTTVEAQAKSDPNLRAYFQQLGARVTQTPSALPQIARTEPVTATPVPTRTLPKESSLPPAPVQPKVAQPAAPATPPQAAPPTQTPAPTAVPGPAEHFLVRFDGKDEPDMWIRIQSILEYAYQDLTHKLSHSPTAPIHVVLHTAQKFPAEVGTPAFADSLFDTATTTIHLPTVGAMEDLAMLSRVVRHQFAHVLIHEKMGGQQHTLPKWLAEGLAIQLAEDPWPDLDDVKEKAPALIPLPSLQGQWDHIPKETLAVAYFESALAGQSLIDRYSMNGVRKVLTSLQAGLSLETAMQQKLSVPYQEFARQWESGALSSGLQKQ